MRLGRSFDTVGSWIIIISTDEEWTSFIVIFWSVAPLATFKERMVIVFAVLLFSVMVQIRIPYGSRSA